MPQEQQHESLHLKTTVVVALMKMMMMMQTTKMDLVLFVALDGSPLVMLYALYAVKMKKQKEEQQPVLQMVQFAFLSLQKIEKKQVA
jgi:Ca2+/Na+ antiporter